MTKTKKIMSILETWGYKPEVDEDGDIMFRYQLKTLYVVIGNEDDSYVSVMLPQFYEFEDGMETLVLAVCNKLTRDLKLAKVFVDTSYKSVTSTCEFYYANDKALALSLRESLHLLGVVRGHFKKNMAELSE